VPYRLIADSLVLFHLTFILFVVTGGFLAWRWRRLVWIHGPVAVWGALIEFVGWVCPLTPLENHFRVLAGQSGYEGGFVEHYLIPLIYPADWTFALRVLLGSLVVATNGVAYMVLWKRRTRGS
jgi:hypothetical protein